MTTETQTPFEGKVEFPQKRSWPDSIAILIIGLIIGAGLAMAYDVSIKYQPVVAKSKRIIDTICWVGVKSDKDSTQEFKMPLAIGLNQKEMDALLSCEGKK